MKRALVVAVLLSLVVACQPGSRSSGVAMLSIDMKIVETGETITKWAWKTTLQGGSAAVKLRIIVKWKDINGFVVEQSSRSKYTIRAGEKKTFSDTRIISNNISNQINSYEISFEEVGRID